MKRTKKIIFSIITCCTLTPYILNIFFFPLFPLMKMVLVFIAFGVFVISSIVFAFQENTLREKIYIPIIGLALFVVYSFTMPMLNHAGAYITYVINKGSLEQLASEIKTNKQISHMTDGQRYWICINDDCIENDKEKSRVEISKQINEILSKGNIEPKVYESFKNKMIGLDFVGFVQFDDHIAFTFDGFIDNCYGFAYSETGVMPAHNTCGEYVGWKKLDDNWYVWSTT